MDRLRDTAWQFIITIALSLITLLFSILTLQSNSLRVGGLVVVIIFPFIIVLINFWPTSKTAGQQQNANNTPTPTKGTPPNYNYPHNIPPSTPGRNPAPSPAGRGAPPQYVYPQAQAGYPPYGYPQAPVSSPRPVSRQPRLTPTKWRVLIISLIGWVIYIAAIALMGSSSVSAGSGTTSTSLLVFGDIILFAAWIFALVDIARLGHWWWFILTLLLIWFGLFFYIFFVPNTPRKAISQPYMR